MRIDLESQVVEYKHVLKSSGQNYFFLEPGIQDADDHWCIGSLDEATTFDHPEDIPKDHPGYPIQIFVVGEYRAKPQSQLPGV